MTFGLSLQKRLVVVSHTKRKDRTRIISARLMDRKERVTLGERLKRQTNSVLSINGKTLALEFAASILKSTAKAPILFS